MCAYAHALLCEETITAITFSFGDELFGFISVSYGLKSLPTFLKHKTNLLNWSKTY